jgi:hypothetical protein
LQVTGRERFGLASPNGRAKFPCKSPGASVVGLASHRLFFALLLALCLLFSIVLRHALLHKYGLSESRPWGDDRSHHLRCWVMWPYQLATMYSSTTARQAMVDLRRAHCKQRTTGNHQCCCASSGEETLPRLGAAGLRGHIANAHLHVRERTSLMISLSTAAQHACTSPKHPQQRAPRRGSVLQTPSTLALKHRLKFPCGWQSPAPVVFHDVVGLEDHLPHNKYNGEHIKHEGSTHHRLGASSDQDASSRQTQTQQQVRQRSGRRCQRTTSRNVRCLPVTELSRLSHYSRQAARQPYVALAGWWS